ncbi:MAG: DUF362 domain-containing protein, partial [Acidobacteria bacterium]|nr:DUF362 domain-containing protein [Acidobacteriota bacterium]
MNRSELPTSFPGFHLVRQPFDGQPVEADIAISVERELERMDTLPAGKIAPGASVALAVGSRGIADIVLVIA